MIIGDLTPDDIGRTSITVKIGDTTVSGQLNEMRLDAESMDVYGLAGEFTCKPGIITVDLTIGNVTLYGLSREHSCEVTE